MRVCHLDYRRRRRQTRSYCVEKQARTWQFLEVDRKAQTAREVLKVLRFFFFGFTNANVDPVTWARGSADKDLDANS